MDGEGEGVRGAVEIEEQDKIGEEEIEQEDEIAVAVEDTAEEVDVEGLTVSGEREDEGTECSTRGSKDLITSSFSRLQTFIS